MGTGEAVVTAGVTVGLADGDADGDAVAAAGFGEELFDCAPAIAAVTSNNPSSDARVTTALVLMIILLPKRARVTVKRGPNCRRSDVKESPATIVKIGIRVQ